MSRFLSSLGLASLCLVGGCVAGEPEAFETSGALEAANVQGGRTEEILSSRRTTSGTDVIANDSSCPWPTSTVSIQTLTGFNCFGWRPPLAVGCEPCSDFRDIVRTCSDGTVLHDKTFINSYIQCQPR